MSNGFYFEYTLPKKFSKKRFEELNLFIQKNINKFNINLFKELLLWNILNNKTILKLLNYTDCLDLFGKYIENLANIKISQEVYINLLKKGYVKNDLKRIPKKYIEFNKFINENSNNIGLSKEEIIKNFEFLLTSSNKRLRKELAMKINENLIIYIKNQEYQCSIEDFDKIMQILKNQIKSK